jgi:hypothetical protein
MSGTTKVLLIVFGALAVLLVLIVSIVFAFGWRMASQSRDPENIRRVAAEFGKFDIPPGYQETMAIDMFITKTLFIGRKPMGKSDFTIFMMKMKTAPRVDSSRSKLPTFMPHNEPLETANCAHLVLLPPEIVRAKRGTFYVRKWWCRETDVEYAMASVRNGDGTIGIGASEKKSSFDMKALRSLLASFR